MASGTVQAGISGLKFTSVDFYLRQQTWTQSGAGMYYISSSNAMQIPGATRIVAVSLNGDWGGIRSTDVVIPYITAQNKVSLMSKTNTFSADSSMVGVDVLYY